MKKSVGKMIFIDAVECSAHIEVMNFVNWGAKNDQ